ncbi:MAG: putative diguanylate cyclase/phosphodiesterase [Frankiales bacterium]|nr:putative diguanylate cyclase/phosphodiesterase [Frankiales bacterium]
MQQKSGRRSAAKLFTAFAALALIPVLALGVMLGVQSKHQAEQRGLDQGRAQADVLGRVISEAMLGGEPLTGPLTDLQERRLRAFSDTEVARSHVLRLRVRGTTGQVLFANSTEGLVAGADDEVDEALDGAVSALLNHLNSDQGDMGPIGERVVEVYLPLLGPGNDVIGVLEVYLPYAPIATELAKELREVYLALSAGLAALYTVLGGLAWWITRRLSRDAAAYEHLALHDSLTGLPNRSLFHQRLQTAIEDTGNGGPGCAVILIDLDRFKEVNDTLGHHNGDLLLVALAERLRTVTRPEDTVARLGGDEFVLVLGRMCTRADVEGRLTILRAAIEEEIELAGLPLAVEASIGVVFAPQDGNDPDTLLQRADVAMYVAKSGHSGAVFYDPAHDDYNEARLALVGELRRAIERDELRLHFQPKAALTSRRVDAVEALMRWQHPTRGLLPPDEFIPMAEQTGLIEPLTEWLLDTALEQLNEWADTAPHLTMALNISTRTLQRSDFPAVVVAALARAGLPAHRLLLEITETALITDPARAASVLRELADAGIALSLDDFGSGYTSLGQLRSLPLSELKIDKSFVLAMMSSPSDAAIVRSVIELGHNLGMTVVAEGVETLATLEAVSDLGCDVAQGYWFSRPRPAPEMADWLAVHWSTIATR